MSRNPSTTVSGGGFTQATIDAVWNKAQVAAGYDAGKFRKDRCGAWITKADYGTTGDHGWEIDHEKPVAKNGTDDFANLEPLHWRNNRGKSDNYPNWSCSLS